MALKTALMAGIVLMAGQVNAAVVPISDYRLKADITALSASFGPLSLVIGNQTLVTGPITATLDGSLPRGSSYDILNFSDGSELVVAHLLMDAPLFSTLGWGAQKLTLTETRAAGAIQFSTTTLETGVANEITMTFNTPLTGVGVFDAGQALSGWRYENWLGLGGSTDKVKVKPPPPPPPPVPPTPPRPIDIFIDPEGTMQRLGSVPDARLISPTLQVHDLGPGQVSVTLATPVPESSTWMMLLAGLGVLVVRRPRRS